MKKILGSIIIHFLFFSSVYAQNIGIGTTTPHSSAILDVKSNTKGILLPRTSTTSRVAIVNPAKGLILYDTTTSGFWFHNGSAWAQLSAGGNGWNLTGNAGTNPSSNFIGTTDNQPLSWRVNNIWAGELDPVSANVFLGLNAGQSNTSSGTGNTAVGGFALLNNTTGYDNTALGAAALYTNTGGLENTAIGRQSLFYNTNGSENTATGYKAPRNNNTGNYNTTSRASALFSNTSGVQNTANGYQALYSNTTGTLNTANGSSALNLNTNGDNNTANGAWALLNNTVGDHNTANGSSALFSNTSGNDNTATGANSLLNNTTGSDNTANGNEALYFNSTGSNNVANGYQALYKNNSGVFNTANGYLALYSNTTGWYNTAIGDGALFNNTSGNSNIAIGSGSGTHPNAGSVYNTISIGNDDMLNAYQNQVFIGNTSTGLIGGKVPWSVISDARVKNTITEEVKGLDFILKLRPVTYHMSNDAITTISGNKKTPDFPGKYDGEKIKYTGFLAQEVEQAAKAANYDFSGYAAPKNKWGLYTLSYEQFVVPLVKAMQEQQVIIDKQQKQIDLLEKRLTTVEPKL